MAVSKFIGRTLIALAICFEAYMLFADPKAIASFAITSCSHLQQFAVHLKQYLRLVVAGLLLTSVFVAITKMCTPKLTTLLGLGILLYVEHHRDFRQIPKISNSQLWLHIAVIGAIIYLLGSDCQSCGKKVEKPAKPSQQKKAKKN